jgi:hypothetical protein
MSYPGSAHSGPWAVLLHVLSWQCARPVSASMSCRGSAPDHTCRFEKLDLLRIRGTRHSEFVAIDDMRQSLTELGEVTYVSVHTWRFSRQSCLRNILSNSCCSTLVLHVKSLPLCNGSSWYQETCYRSLFVQKAAFPKEYITFHFCLKIYIYFSAF